MRVFSLIFIFGLFYSCNSPSDKESIGKFDYMSNEVQSNSNFIDKNKDSNTLIETNELSSNVLKVEIQDGVRYVWIEINGINLRFIFDTGASKISISSAEASVLFRQGTLVDEDIIATEYMQDATGGISEVLVVNLRIVKIGNVVLENIEAVVIDDFNAPLLLGQSALEMFGNIEINNEKGEIVFK